jgi:hypothetical protein
MKFRAILLSVFAVAFMFAFSKISYACSCELPLSKDSIKKQVKVAKKKSQAVFAGEVLEITEPSGKNFLLVRIRIELNWKGAKGNEIMIVTGKGNGDCGYSFTVGQRYLVYAYQTSNSQLSTNICQRTALLSDAEKDIAILENR